MIMTISLKNTENFLRQWETPGGLGSYCRSVMIGDPELLLQYLLSKVPYHIFCTYTLHLKICRRYFILNQLDIEQTVKRVLFSIFFSCQDVLRRLLIRDPHPSLCKAVDNVC